MGLLTKALLKDETPLGDRVKDSVAEYHASHTVFQAAVFELPLCHAAAYDTRKRLATMLSSLGILIPLSSKYIVRDLVLFPDEIDRELVIHRLTKSLGVMSPQSFEANSPEYALALLEPFIKTAVNPLT
ncbi:MAG: hypothetical protein LBJ41_00170 [Treponema sp.]|jgi:hypothetical protein|nr:hypothetical protein [Treponema sp.]